MTVIDWGQAVKIAGVGIGMVAVVLTLLAVAIWLLGILTRRAVRRR